MGNVLVEETSLSNIASAIREKSGGSATYKPGEMAAAISNLPTGGSSSDIEDNIITRNISGDYTNDRVSSIGDGAFYNSNVSSISMSNVTSIGDNSICRCRNLVSVDLPALTTIREYKDMNNAINDNRFSISNNPNLVTINCPNLTNVERSYGLFATNPKLVSINWSPTNGSLSTTFNGDSSLTNIDLSQFHGSISGGMFAWCSNLQSISFSNSFSFGNTSVQGMFSDCKSLTSLNLSNGGYVSASYYDFQNNLSLTWLKANFTSLVGQVFQKSSALKTFILPQTDSNKMCELLSPSNTVFSSTITSTTGDGYVYVPRTLLESYKTATNWVVMASKIRAIEDYPDITGG